MTQITIHGFAPSTYTRTARMAAVELGVDHALVPLAFGKPEHLELHPFGKMPVLTHDDETIFETLAIVMYLDRTFGDGTLFRDGSLVRNLQTISVANDYAYKPVVHVEKGNDDQRAKAGGVFDWLEKQLANSTYLAGPEFGAADLFVAPMLDYHIHEAGSDHLWSGRPKLRAWFESVSGRPSFCDTGANSS